MKKADPSVSIDTESEINAIAKYLAPRWQGAKGDLTPVVRRIHAEAKRLARGWFASTTVFFPLAEQVKLRRSVLELSLKTTREREIGPEYDRVSRQLSSMLLSLDRLRDAALNLETEGRWDYERQAKRVAEDIQRAFPWATDIKPNGWELMRTDYTDYRGMTDWDDKTSRADFEGHEFAVRALDLVSATALPNVMYDDVNQGRRPTYTFVSAIFSHCLSLTEHNNTVGMLQEIQRLQLEELPSEVIFEHGIRWNHPLWRALDNSIQTMEADRAKTYNRAAYEAELSAVTKAMSDEEKRTVVAQMIAEIKAEERNGEQAKRQSREHQLYQLNLRAVLVPPRETAEADGPMM